VFNQNAHNGLITINNGTITSFGDNQVFANAVNGAPTATSANQ
jgi:hypothetical protein